MVRYIAPSPLRTMASHTEKPRPAMKSSFSAMKLAPSGVKWMAQMVA